MPDELDPLDEAELSELADLVVRGADVEWEMPPPQVWVRIERELDLDPKPEVVTARPRGRHRVWGIGLAAAAAAIVAVTAAVVVDRNRGDQPDVIAAVDLTRLGSTGSGRAELVDDGGRLQVRLETSDLHAVDDGYFELWLIDPTVTSLISLGPLRDDGIYDVPAGVDIAAFPIVDVSAEPIDGDPTHSTDSVLRGEFSI